MVISKVSLGKNECYQIPDELMIAPNLILDETSNVYRVSVGRANLSPDEAALYEPFFNAIRKRIKSSPFVSDIHFIVNGKILTFDLAFVNIAADHIYEFEMSTDDDLVYKDIPVEKGKKKRGKTKSKATKR